MDYGVYKLKLLVNVFFQHSKMLTKTSECFFEFKQIRKQTIIYGGSLRMINFQFDLYFEVLTMLAPGRQVLSESTEVTYFWYCPDTKVWFCEEFESSESHRLIKGPLASVRKEQRYFHDDRRVIKEYDFKLFIDTAILQSNGEKINELGSQTQTVWVTDSPGVNMGLVWLLNCGGSIFRTNSQEIIHLQVKFNKSSLTPEKKVRFNWFYRKEPDKNLTFVPTNIRSNDVLTEDSELRIKRDALNDNSVYNFTVTMVHDRKILQSSDIVIYTSTIPSGAKCTVNLDKKTIRSIHFYDVYCQSKNQKEPVSVMYEFYNKNDSNDTGRHLGFSMTGVLVNVLLTREQLYVRVINLVGTSSETQINVGKSQLNFTLMSKVEEELGFVFGFQGFVLRNSIYRFNLISAYCDLLSSSTKAQFKFEKVNALLQKLNAQHVVDIPGAIMLQSVLSNIVRIINNTEPKRLLTSESVAIIASLMNSVSKVVVRVYTEPKTTSRLTTIERIHGIARELLTCSNLVLETKQYYDLIESDTRDNLKKSTHSMMEALKNILTSIVLQQQFAINEFNMTSKNILFEVVRLRNEELKLNNIREKDGILKLSPVPKLHINIISFDINPFWWSNGYTLQTNVKIYYLHKKTQHLYHWLSDAKFPLKLHIHHFEYSNVSGVVKQPNPNNSPEMNDEGIAVHRIKSGTNSLLFINFTNIENATSLRVVLLQDKRPDFDYMTSSISKVITTDSPILKFRMENLENSEFFYIGILPGSDVEVDRMVIYNFTIFCALCLIWKYGIWTSSNQCAIGKKSTENVLHCECPFVSEIVGGDVYAPDHQFNPFSDFPLFISDTDHPLIVIVVVIVFLLYFLLLIWTRLMDKKDKKELNVIVLEDNDPRDSTAYLVGVFTGARLAAGTTSNIGIRLFGDKGFSRAHILNSLQRPTFKCNSDSWFLLFTPHHLGSLTDVLLWTDHFGVSPSWYCSKILVFDMVSNESHSFYIESWFGTTVQGIILQVFKECATYSENFKVSRVISENLQYCFLESHYWASVFLKHPRSPVTRTQRLTVAVCGLFVSILACTLLFSPSHSEDFSLLNINKNILTIGMIGGILGNLVPVIIMQYFYNSYTVDESPFHFHSSADSCDIYYLRQKVILLERQPRYIRNLLSCFKRYLSPIKALPLQSIEHTLVGIKINKLKIKTTLFLCVALIIIFSHIIIVCGFHYRTTKTFQLFTSIVLSIFLMNLVIAPLHVFIIAISLGCARTRYYEIMTFRIGLSNILHALRQKYSKNYNRYLVRLRNLQMYQPPAGFKFKKLTADNRRFIITVGLYYTIGCIMFLVVIIWLIHLFETYLYYLMNMQTFCADFGTREMCETVYRYDLENVIDFWDSIPKRVFPLLYSQTWYNGQDKSLPQELFHETGWLNNGASRLIGVPQLRQIRDRPDTVSLCHVPKVMRNITSKCHLASSWLSTDTEDHTDYGVGWSNTLWSGDALFESSPWKYTAPSPEMRSLRGPSGHLYHSGGYIASLHRNLFSTEVSISSLYDTNWIDDKTRVIITDFLMYNTNKNVFTETFIVTEILTGGSVKVIYYFKSLRISSFSKPGVLFILIAVAFTVQFICLMNITGAQRFLSNIWNLYDGLILLVFVYSMTLYCHWLSGVSNSKEKLSKQGKDVFFTIGELTEFSYNIRNSVGVLFCLMLFRLLRSVHFDEGVKLYVKDLLAARTEIFFAFLITMMLMFVQFRFIMFLTVSPPAYSFKDVLIFRSQFKTAVRNTYQRTSTGKLLAYLLNFTTQLGIFTFMLTQYHHFKKAQENRGQLTERRQKRAKTLIDRLERSAIKY